ncbi:MAG: hypothetical protein ACFFB3_04380 [Candidatus Hodarchaeota archaeon]
MSDYIPKILYTVLLIEISFALWFQSWIILVLLLVFSILAIMVRLNRMKLLTRQTQPGPGLRVLLHRILVANKILPPAPDDPVKFLSSSDIAEIEKESLMLGIPDSTLVENLRFMGVDGILICIMLLQQEATLLSAKSLHRNLQIPLSTVYRTLQRIAEKKMVKMHYTLDEPGKTYYCIASDGESIIIQLYEWLCGIDTKFLPTLQISEKMAV